MKPALIDTDILSLFLRNQLNVVKRFEEYLKEYEKINFSILTYYEILSGLKYKDAQKQLNSFLELTEHSSVLLVTEDTAEISAEIYADLRKRGELIDDIDILIAGITIAKKLVLVTHNRSHFERITDLEIEDWSEDEATHIDSSD